MTPDERRIDDLTEAIADQSKLLAEAKKREALLEQQLKEHDRDLRALCSRAGVPFDDSAQFKPYFLLANKIAVALGDLEFERNARRIAEGCNGELEAELRKSQGEAAANLSARMAAEVRTAEIKERLVAAEKRIELQAGLINEAAKSRPAPSGEPIRWPTPTPVWPDGRPKLFLDELLYEARMGRADFYAAAFLVRACSEVDMLRIARKHLEMELASAKDET